MRDLVLQVEGLKKKSREAWLRSLEEKNARWYHEEGFEAPVENERDVRYWPLPGDEDDDEWIPLGPTVCGTSQSSSSTNQFSSSSSTAFSPVSPLDPSIASQPSLSDADEAPIDEASVDETHTRANAAPDKVSSGDAGEEQNDTVTVSAMSAAA